MGNKIDTYGIKNVNFSLIKENDPRFEDFKKQRLERGFDSSELWSLDCTIAEFIAPRLKAFKEASDGGYPGSYESAKAWQDDLDAMIEGFEIYPNHFNWSPEEQEINWKKVDKAMSLFHKHFFRLWY